MDVMNPKAVVGTNSWGTALYGKLLRGSVVGEQIIRESVETAWQQGLLCFDFAQDYGFGKAQKILDRAGIPLYGVQNHYSLINREWETSGLVAWCRENKVQFWAWAVLEEGMLVDPRIKTGKSIMKVLFDHKKRKLYPLYAVMNKIGKQHSLTIPQIAISYCSNKGIVPICGCRRPQQVRELRQAVDTVLTADELRRLEQAADRINVHILGSDLFRFAVKK